MIVCATENTPNNEHNAEDDSNTPLLFILKEVCPNEQRDCGNTSYAIPEFHLVQDCGTVGLREH